MYAPSATVIRCDHQIQTREGDAACRCTEQVPLTSFWGNQTGYESRLHCLQQDLDCQTQGYYEGRPHSWHCLLAYSAGMATPKKALLQMARAYWDFRDQLSTDEGLLLMGPRIVILSCLHEEYLGRLHQGHLSAMKVQQNAYQHLYWLGLDADIVDYTRRRRNAFAGLSLPKSPCKLMMCHRSLGRGSQWTIST